MFNRRDRDNNYGYQNQDISNQQEINALNLQLLQMRSLYNNAQKEVNHYKGEYSKLKNITENMCKNLLSNDYNRLQLGGNNKIKDMDIYALLEFALQDFTSQKMAYIDEIKKLNATNSYLSDRVSQLQNSLAEELGRKSNIQDIDFTQDDIVDGTNTFEDSVPEQLFRTDDFSKPYKKPPSTTQKINKENTFKNTSDGNKKNLALIDMNTMVSGLTAPDWVIIEAIGSAGFSESTDILNWVYSEFSSEYDSSKRSRLLGSLTNLLKLHILDATDVSVSSKSFKVYKLSNIGLEIFRDKFGYDAVEPECDKIIKEHDNLQHGYAVKEVYRQINCNFQVKSITMNRNETSIKLKDGETYIADIIVTLSDNKKYYIEVELGNTEATPGKDTTDFSKKCNKMYQVTKTFVIVSDSAVTKKKNEEKISKWIVDFGGTAKFSSLTIYTPTIAEITKSSNNSFGKPFLKI